MYGQYSRAVSNQEQVIVARVRYIKSTFVLYLNSLNQDLPALLLRYITKHKLILQNLFSKSLCRPCNITDPLNKMASITPFQDVYYNFSCKNYAPYIFGVIDFALKGFNNYGSISRKFSFDHFTIGKQFESRLSPLARADFEIKVKRIAHSIVHFDQWNKLISKM